MKDLLKLAPNWRTILKRAHSVKLMTAAILIQALAEAWPYFEDYVPISKKWFGLMAMALTAMALYARFMYQPQVHRGKHDE